MKMILMAGAAALATGAALLPATAQTTAATTVAVPNNVLLADWKGPYQGVPPWDQVKPEQFDEAIQFAVDELKREAAAIANNPAPPTFANTIEASEKAGERVSNVLSVFSVMTDNMSSPAYEALDKKWSPLLSAAFDEISLDPKYFARVETLYNQRARLGLDAKQTRLLTRTYDSLVRRGVKLDEP
jgi:peptidyl-dipeptidase Dcp